MVTVLCQRLVVPPGSFQVHTTATVKTADAIDVDFSAPYIPIEELPDPVLQFLLPSQYCQSDQLGHLALEIVGDAMPGYAHGFKPRWNTSMERAMPPRLR